MTTRDSAIEKAARDVAHYLADSTRRGLLRAMDSETTDEALVRVIVAFDAATKRADEAEALALDEREMRRNAEGDSDRWERAHDRAAAQRDAAVSALATAEATMRERCAVVCDENAANEDAHAAAAKGETRKLRHGYAIHTSKGLAARIRSLASTAAGEKS